MAASGKPPENKVEACVRDALRRHVPPASRLLLALSGGLDSTVLLRVLAALRARHPFDLVAVHVHHGLSPNAGDWADACARLCAAQAVPLRIERILVDPDDAAGVEAAARRERYRVFDRCAADFLLTAHHQDDQAETFLLQALRGAGPKGLAAMAECRQRRGGRMAHLRPLLGVSRTELLDAARAAGLDWIEDESNRDTRYRRNALRHEILPRLNGHFPALAATLSRAAAHQAEAALLLDDLAHLDAAGAIDGARLDCTALARLSPPRARNLLRHFIERQGVRLPAARRLDEALKQLRDARADARVFVEIEAAGIRRYRGGAYVVPACALPPPVVWQGESELRLPGLGRVLLREAVGQGLRAEALRSGRTRLGLRSGGERLRQTPGGPAHSLKTLWQAHAVPPWERDRAPILRLGDAVLWVAGFGCDADWLAQEGAPGWVPEWVPERHPLPP